MLQDIKCQRVMMFNATFNNISVISWWSVLLVDEEELEDAKGVIRIRILKKNRQHNGGQK